MDLVDEQDVSFLEIGEDPGEVARLFDLGSRGGVNLGAHRAGDNVGEGGFSEPGRTKEEGVVESLISISRRVDEHPEVRAKLVLADEFAEPPRPERFLVGAFVRLRVADENFISHVLTLPYCSRPPNPEGSKQSLDHRRSNDH